MKIKKYMLQQINDKITVKLFEYHVFVGKKYLWNSFNSEKSRVNFSKAIRIKAIQIFYLFFIHFDNLTFKLVEYLYNKLKSENI